METLAATKVYREVTMLRTLQTQMHDLTPQLWGRDSENPRLNFRPRGPVFYIELAKGRTSMLDEGGKLQVRH